MLQRSEKIWYKIVTFDDRCNFYYMKLLPAPYEEIDFVELQINYFYWSPEKYKSDFTDYTEVKNYLLRCSDLV